MSTKWPSTVVCFFAALSLQAQAPDVTEAPKAIQELSNSIQGKAPEEVHTAIVKKFGPAQRDIGSGVTIEQWDVSGGVLTWGHGGNPTFLDSTTHKRFHLVKTSSPAGSNLLGSYEMTTNAPDTKENGLRYWIGNLELKADMTYRFEDSEQNLEHRKEQTNNFFLQHPVGKIVMHFVAPVGLDTPLESVTEKATVARVDFVSADTGQQANFSILCSELGRRLDFGTQEGLPFSLSKGW